MNYEKLTFETQKDFREWLNKNHSTCDGIWIVFGKAGGPVTLKYDQALEEALCYGWIDGQVKSIDDVKYVRKFTPRRKNSNWSDRNKKIVAGLIEKGLVMPAGYEAIELAKTEGMWDKKDENTVAGADTQVMMDALKGRQPALQNFMNMSPSVQRTYTAFYQDAKREETRVRRLEKIIDRLNKNLKPM